MSLGKVIKSISDKRIYKPLSLKNDLQCLIISDKDALKSGAALSVGVGSFLDPFEAQGIAHYLEHMLFMGTAKYPEENEYSNVILVRLSFSAKMLAPPTHTLHLMRQIISLKPPMDRLSKPWTGFLASLSIL
jgi:predicted Zn-dependent peptidase